jgi:hypothetical protein
MLTYLIKGNRSGTFVISEENVNALEKRAENIVGISAQNVANWKYAKNLLKPAEVILQSLARSTGIEFSEADITDVLDAIKTDDVKLIETAVDKMYSNGLAQYKGRKRTFLDKLIKFQRMAMLSGPGTIIRNYSSNILVDLGNKASERIGSSASKLIERLFPKKKWRAEGQYEIVGTKVTSDVKSFIQTHIIDSKLLDLVKDGLTKYDVRKSKHEGFSSQDSIKELIVKSIESRVFQENTFKSETLNKAHEFLMKLLADEKPITKAAIRYLGKILVEDNVDLTKGMTTDVINSFAEAYKLASYDYMHKSNFFTKIESTLKQEWGNGAYFMYKQLFPFASSSWNWFAEGINYTPIGLAKAIINFAKLENTIDKIEQKRKRGEQVPSDRFTEYLVKRNIGKGVIGSIGWAIGTILTLLGFAGIDEEDEKYKLFIHIGDEKVYVDISDIFGTQGIMLGIAITSGFKDGNWSSVIGDTLDTLFLDSIFSDVFNTFRYSTSLGEWLTEQPFAFLQMFVPNFIKTLTSISYGHKVKYSSGIQGKLEQLGIQSIPGLAYLFPKHKDIYSGETQVAYKMWYVTKLANKLLPFKIYPYNVSEIEKEAISVGVKRAALTGRYKVNDKDVTLNSEMVDELNTYYGTLNKQELEILMSNKKSYKVLDDENGKYVEIKYSKMTDKQKKTVIERIMNDNGQISKVYVLTQFGYKYYASESEYEQLKKLGIKNVYKKTDKLEGFKESTKS